MDPSRPNSQRKGARNGATAKTNSTNQKQRYSNQNMINELRKVHDALERQTGQVVPYNEVNRMIKQRDFGSQQGLVDQLLSAPNTKKQASALISEVGRKTMAMLDKAYPTSQLKDKIRMLKTALMDDYSTDLAASAGQLLWDYGPDLWEQAMAYFYPEPSTLGNTYTPMPSFNQTREQVQLPHVSSMNTGFSTSANYKPDMQIIYEQDAYDIDAVNVEYLCGVIQPEDYVARRPLEQQPLKTALATQTLSINVTTNASGNCALYVYPNNLAGLPAVDTTFCTILNDPTFNSLTGTQAAAPTYTTGPLNVNLTSTEQLFSSAFSVSFQSQVSGINESGQYQIIYFTRPPNQTFITGAQAAIPTAQLGLSPYYQIGSINKDMPQPRAVRIPQNSDSAGISSFQQQPVNSRSEGFYFLFTGASPSAIIGTLQVTFMTEFIPTASATVIAPTLYAQPGSATGQCISNLFMQFPMLQRQSYAQAQHFTQDILASRSKDHNALIKVARQHYLKHDTKGVQVVNYA